MFIGTLAGTMWEYELAQWQSSLRTMTPLSRSECYCHTSLSSCLGVLVERRTSSTQDADTHKDMNCSAIVTIRISITVRQEIPLLFNLHTLIASYSFSSDILVEVFLLQMVRDSEPNGSQNADQASRIKRFNLQIFS